MAQIVRFELRPEPAPALEPAPDKRASSDKPAAVPAQGQKVSSSLSLSTQVRQANL